MKKLLISISLLLASITAGAKIPVYIVAGQSNADGRALVSEMPDAIQDYVRNNGSELIKMSYCNGTTRKHLGEFEKYVPMYESNSSKYCGFDAIVYNLIETSRKKRFYVIKESKGGTAIDTLCKSSASLYWNADQAWLEQAGIADYNKKTKETTGKSLLLQLEANIDACIDNVLAQEEEGYEIKCIIWHQGESDRKKADNYYDNLKTLVAHLRKHIAEKTGEVKYASLPVIAGSVSRQSKQYSKVVEESKLRLAEEDKNFHVVDLEGCELRSDDNLHFNASGCVEAGNRVYDKLTELGLVDNK